MTFPKCEDGFNRRKLTNFAKGVVDDLKGIGKFFNPPGVSAYYVPPNVIGYGGKHTLYPNYLMTYPYLISVPITVSGAGFYGDLKNGAELLLGLYDSTDDGYPRNLLRSANLSGSGESHFFVSWDPINLEPGFYWTAILGYNMSDPYIEISSFNSLLVPVRFEPKDDLPTQRWYLFDVSPPLPNPFPAEALEDNVPLISVFLRISQG
jgi:hypothetical protein